MVVVIAVVMLIGAIFSENIAYNVENRLYRDKIILSDYKLIIALSGTPMQYGVFFIPIFRKE